MRVGKEEKSDPLSIKIEKHTKPKRPLLYHENEYFGQNIQEFKNDFLFLTLNFI